MCIYVLLFVNCRCCNCLSVFVSECICDYLPDQFIYTTDRHGSSGCRHCWHHTSVSYYCNITN